MRRIKHLVFDIIGVTLIIISPLLGWVPGPGGIPLFLAGLGFLSVHHDWAKRLLESVKKNGLQLLDVVYKDHPIWKAAYDILSVVLVGAGIYLINTYTRNLTLTLSIFLLFTGLGLFIGNRKRLQRFQAWLKSLLSK